MFRLEDGKDVSDKEYKTLVNPHIKKIDLFNENYILPEIAAFYIATGYYDSAIWEGSLIVHIESAIDNCDMPIKSKKKLIARVKELLLVKYGLKVETEDPLTVTKI